EDLTGGTFTITNGGVFGSLMSTPIVNSPQSAILGMHKIQERPMVVSGPGGTPQIAIRPMMYLAVTYDHRIIGGGPAGYPAAIRAGQNKLSVACIDEWKNLDGSNAFGGTCLNAGCIPSK